MEEARNWSKRKGKGHTQDPAVPVQSETPDLGPGPGRLARPAHAFQTILSDTEFLYHISAARFSPVVPGSMVHPAHRFRTETPFSAAAGRDFEGAGRAKDSAINIPPK
jgi:hypothetical protein